MLFRCRHVQHGPPVSDIQTIIKRPVINNIQTQVKTLFAVSVCRSVEIFFFQTIRLVMRSVVHTRFSKWMRRRRGSKRRTNSHRSLDYLPPLPDIWQVFIFLYCFFFSIHYQTYGKHIIIPRLKMKTSIEKNWPDFSFIKIFMIK